MLASDGTPKASHRYFSTKAPKREKQSRKGTGDGSELEIVTIPAEDSAEKMNALFSALEAYVNGLDGQAAKWYRVASLPKKGARKGQVSYKDEQLKLTQVKNGYIGVTAGQRIKARPQTTFSLDISKFPEQLKTFSQARHYREAKTGAAPDGEVPAPPGGDEDEPA